MANRINHRTGHLCPRPSRMDATPSSIEVDSFHTFFIGKNHPLEYSTNYHKVLKEAYHVESDGWHLNLMDGPHDLDEKPQNLSFDTLLEYLRDQRELTQKSLPEIVCGASIVCRRGVLNKLFNAPYDRKCSFLFAVKKFQGVYFIRELNTPSSGYQSANCMEAQLYLSKFKNLVIEPISDEIYSPPENVVSTWEQMQRIFTCTLSSSTRSLLIFYGSEIDSLDHDGNVVEIKLQRDSFGTSVFDDIKLRKWYYQCQLVGCDNILLGLRNNEIVTKVVRTEINNFQQLVDKKNQWNPPCSYTAALNILTSTMEFYDRNVQANEVLIVDLLPENPQIKYYVDDEKDHNILPDTFKEAFEEPKKNESCYLIATADGWLDDVISQNS